MNSLISTDLLFDDMGDSIGFLLSEAEGEGDGELFLLKNGGGEEDGKLFLSEGKV